MKTALVTGCSSGIGSATARSFLEEEWAVYATARDPDDIGDLGGSGCETAALDVTEGRAAERVVDRIIDETGRLDCVVNNAGYAQFGPLEDLPPDRIRRQFDVNVHGVHRLTRAALPHMRERGDGTIVNVSSVSGGFASFPGGGAYCGSKAALEAMSDALRAEVGPAGVDVVLVQPGPVNTRFGDRAERELSGFERSPAYGELYGLIEDARIVGGGGPFAIAPDEVAAVIVNAASATDPAARYPVGPVARLLRYASFLPATVVDTAYGMVHRLLR